ncbi:MAG: trypsin-like peptidase domain-containing protein [Planctomycetes bacterium]|nr:trypsin-like peptidase domain-containing protein [Planctomycetota bacterium]
MHELQLGDSRKAAVGDEVFALGNPFGLGGTFSRGIISAVGRSNIVIRDISYQGFIQTDAVINPGNSGGPLVDRRGEVIGINTAIATGSGQFAGVGFAIPSWRASQLIPRLIARGHVVRGYLGVIPVDIRDERNRVEALGWSEDYGVFIALVAPDTPADKAGLHVGDILVSINDHRVTDATDLRDQIALIAPDSVVTLLVWRDGEYTTIEATLSQRRSPPL